MASWDEIKNNVEKNGNVLTVTMEELREAHGVGKLGVHVREAIRKTLAGMGLGHVPSELPTSQGEFVRLYKKGTDVGEWIDTAFSPGESNDRKLVERFNSDSPDYASVIEKIRELVAED